MTDHLFLDATDLQPAALLNDVQGQRHCRVQMSAGDVAADEDADHEGEAVAEAHREEVLGVRVEHLVLRDGAVAEEDEEESAEDLGEELPQQERCLAALQEPVALEVPEFLRS